MHYQHKQVDHSNDLHVIKQSTWEILTQEQLRTNLACINAMGRKCDECLEEKPQADDMCTVKDCPLYFMTRVFFDYD